MNYYRKPKNKVIDDVKSKMQLRALTLKISENNNKIDDLIGVDKNISNSIDNNKNNIQNNKKSINNNKTSIENNKNDISINKYDISNNKNKIDNFTQYLKSVNDFSKFYNIDKQIFEFNKNIQFYNIFEQEIEYDFLENSLLIVKNNIYYNYDDLSNDYNRLQHEYNICDDDDNLIHKYLFNKDVYYDINLNPILKTNEDFCIRLKKDYKKIKIKLELHRHNRYGFGNINLQIDDNNQSYINIDYLDKNNTGRIIRNENKIDDNANEINIIKNDINYNTYDISVLNNYYNLSKIFIYDIKSTSQFVDKTNPFHLFEKEIIHTFKKDSYLEIMLKILTEISNYILIGFFQILCNFYDDSSNLFYNISLSTAAGSINKLSTVKSVFMVPINKDTSKIKIDFFIKPKADQQNRSATFNVIDINSNKIYIKYFQK